MQKKRARSSATGFFSKKSISSKAALRVSEEKPPSLLSPDDDEANGDYLSASSPSSNAAPRTNSAELLHKLIDLQSFGGSWDLTSKLCALLGISLNNARAKVNKKLWAVWATVLAIVFCKAKCQSEEDVWDLVVGKAEEWLEGKVQEGGVDFEGGLEGLKGEAKGLLGC
jgi:hypothetical protein